MRSCAAPPKTIAPRRPLPTGRASVRICAGLVYQRVVCAPAAVTERRRRPARSTLAFYRYRRQIAAGDDTVDHAVLDGLVGLHDVVAVDVFGVAVDRLA